jgi:hypothetical protein
MPEEIDPDTNFPRRIFVGQHLFTRDGRVCGNALVIAKGSRREELNPPYRQAWLVETDFGNVVEHSAHEIERRYHLINPNTGKRQISSPGQWREEKRSRSADAAEKYPHEQPERPDA